MKLIINKDRSVIPIGTWGTKNENDFEIVDFEFPEELEGYNKRIVYYLGDEKVWDAIVDNKAYITNAITTKSDVKAYVWCTKENTEREADTDFRTMLFEMHFYENENADGIVPTEEQVDGFNTLLTAMNEKIEEIDELETTIKNAETQRQENEETRQNNEKTRQENEQTRQNQEAERERRTDKAIADIKDKTAEYNQNAEAKTNEFNQNATQKTNDFNSNYTQKVNDFNTNASSKELAFNSNASSKTSAFNSNAETKTNAFNTNATNKTNDFNTNAENKTSAFNTNANDKTSTFNDNATQKTTNFDNNASEKTDEFNTNAQNKIDEYDEHIVEYQAQIDELQEEVEELSENMPWNTTEQATEITVDDAAKYSKNKLELFGNTEQASYEGRNVLKYDDTLPASITKKGLTVSIDKNGIVTVNGTATGQEFFGLVNGGSGLAGGVASDATKNNLQIDSNSTYTLSCNKIEGTCPNGWHISSRMVDIGWKEPSVDGSTTFSGTSGVNQIYIGVSGNYTFDNFKFTLQLEEGSTATDYEPYVGGQPSPSPDYPQDIHVVKGHNEFKIANAGDTEFQTLELDLPEGMEMCKLGIQDNKYREDFFFKNTENSQYYNSELNLNSWYKKQSIKHIKFDNTSSVWVSKNEVDQTFIFAFSAEIYASNWSIEINNYIKYWRGLFVETGSLIRYDGAPVFIIKFNEFGFNSDLTANQAEELFREKLATTPLDIYYDMREGHNKSGLYTIDVEITDETLIAQLDAIYEHLQLVKGTNNITVTAEDLAPYMKLSYMQDLPAKLDKLDSRLALLE